MATETLNCAVGDHPWERTRTRGRKPTHCPEHLWVKLGLPEPQGASQEPTEPSKPAPPSPPPAPEEPEPEEKRVRHPVEQKRLAEEALTSERVGPETKRKLRYCYDRFESGAGTSHLLGTYKMILREANRRLF